jgi:type II secretory pathway component PulM
MIAPRALAGSWDARSARERAVLVAGAALIVLAALYAFLWEPGLAARARLGAALPKLRAQVEDMRLQQKELGQLRKSLAAKTAPADLKALLQSSAAGTAFAASVERVEALSPGRALFAAGAVGFDAWLEWVEALQRDSGVRVETCRVLALDQPGMVRVEARFASAAAAGK